MVALQETFFQVWGWAFIVLRLGLGMYFRIRAARGGPVSRRDEGLLILIGLRFFAVIGGFALVLYCVNPAWMRWSQVQVPSWLRIVGAALTIPMIAIAMWALHALGHNVTDTVVPRPDGCLVTKGPYRWVRHPLYTCQMIGVVAVPLLTANWFLAALWIAVFALLFTRTRIEEAKLLERFGENYRTYMARTGRLIPRVAW